MSTDPSPWPLARDAATRGVMTKLVLSKPRGASDATLRSLAAKPVEVRAGARLQVVWRYDKRDQTQTLPIDEAIAVLEALTPVPFRHVHVYTTELTLHVAYDRHGKPHTKRGPPTSDGTVSRTHDRTKQRAVAPSATEAGSWMVALGLAQADGKPARQAAAKHRQVLRFMEVLDHFLSGVPRPEDGRCRWVDLGCGRGALTFALWDYLRQTGFHAAEVTGVELRPELAANNERHARAVGCDGLRFIAGAIADADLGEVDGVLALHACDTATDDALAAGVKAAAAYLLAAPCCHKELRPALEAPAGQHPVLRHGILKTRQAEIVTDALRATLLEAAGYETKVFEFVSSEHTDKNLMITAVRRSTGADPNAHAAAAALAAQYGIGKQRLADHLELSLHQEPQPPTP